MKDLCGLEEMLLHNILSQTNGVRPNKKADYRDWQSTLLFGLHAVFCLSELSRVRGDVEFQSFNIPGNFIINAVMNTP